MNVSGGTKITATADSTSVDPNSNGTTSTGAAIAVSQHVTKLPISVTIDGAELTGASALVANNPQNNGAEDIAKVEVIIEDGQFTGLVNTNEGGKIEAAGGTFDRLGDKVEVTAADVEMCIRDRPYIAGLQHHRNHHRKDSGSQDSCHLRPASIHHQRPAQLSGSLGCFQRSGGPVPRRRYNAGSSVYRCV